MLQVEVARSSSGEAASNMGATTGILLSNVEWNPVLELARGGGLGSRPKKMYGERLGDGVEYHLMKATPRC